MDDFKRQTFSTKIWSRKIVALVQFRIRKIQSRSTTVNGFIGVVLGDVRGEKRRFWCASTNYKNIYKFYETHFFTLPQRSREKCKVPIFPRTKTFRFVEKLIERLTFIKNWFEKSLFVLKISENVQRHFILGKNTIEGAFNPRANDSICDLT